MNRHWSDDELIARLYESDGESVLEHGEHGEDGHIAGCPGCSARWRALLLRREEAMEPVVVSNAMLVAQQQRILARLGEPVLATRPRKLIWAPALAVAFLLAVGVFFLKPPPPPPESSETDAQLFTDVYAMEQEVEPRAAAPVRAMFEEEQ
jgi:hypothetical protein